MKSSLDEHYYYYLIIIQINAKFFKQFGAGVKTVDVDLKQQKATVSGYVEPIKVLKRVQATKKKVEMWPYVPYSMVADPYISGAYDKKAPPGFVRAVDTSTANITETRVDEYYTTIFNEDNPNACSIM